MLPQLGCTTAARRPTGRTSSALMSGAQTQRPEWFHFSAARSPRLELVSCLVAVGLSSGCCTGRARRPLCYPQGFGRPSARAPPQRPRNKGRPQAGSPPVGASSTLAWRPQASLAGGQLINLARRCPASQPGSFVASRGVRRKCPFVPPAPTAQGRLLAAQEAAWGSCLERRASRRGHSIASSR